MDVPLGSQPKKELTSASNLRRLHELKFFSTTTQIYGIKKALKAAEKDPFLYKDEELIKLKTSLRKLREEEELTRQAQNGGFGYNV